MNNQEVDRFAVYCRELYTAVIGDYRDGEFESRSKLFRILTGVACLIGLTVPVLRASPIAARIATTGLAGVCAPARGDRLHGAAQPAQSHGSA